MTVFDLQINQKTYQVEADGVMPLLWVLRDLLSLTGTKFSCGMGECGSCTVLVDDEPTRSCITPLSSVEGKSIITIEGLSEAASHPVQKAWLEEKVSQCGYCLPGQILNAVALLKKTPEPTDADIDAAMGDVGLSSDNVTVHVPLIGGGFGRRLQIDYAIEAAKLSKAINAPVQVVWTRDDDLQHDFYHSLAVKYASAAPDKMALPIISVTNGFGVPTWAWRSVENFTRAYSEQSFIAEKADALERDPLDVWREIYANNERALGVINLAAEKSNWGKALPTGQGRGLAYFATFGVTHVADVAEVSVMKEEMSA